MSERLRICYHGTTEENAALILQEGFAPTRFAMHLEDALSFGGEHIFEVVFPADFTSRDGWQFTTEERIPPDRIVRFSRLQMDEILVNEDLRRQVFESNSPFYRGKRSR